MTKLRLGHSYRPAMAFDELADEWRGQYVGVSERTRRTMREWLVAARATQSGCFFCRWSSIDFFISFGEANLHVSPHPSISHLS